MAPTVHARSGVTHCTWTCLAQGNDDKTASTPAANGGAGSLAVGLCASLPAGMESAAPCPYPSLRSVLTDGHTSVQAGVMDRLAAATMAKVCPPITPSGNTERDGGAKPNPSAAPAWKELPPSRPPAANAGANDPGYQRGKCFRCKLSGCRGYAFCMFDSNAFASTLCAALVPKPLLGWLGPLVPVPVPVTARETDATTKKHKREEG